MSWGFFHGTVYERGFEWAGSASPWSAQGLSGDNQTAGGELNRAMCQKFRSKDEGTKSLHVSTTISINTDIDPLFHNAAMGKHFGRYLRAVYLVSEMTAVVRDNLRVVLQRPLFPLLELPSDLVLLIASHLHDTRPLSRLARTSRALHGLLMPLLYQRATKKTRPDIPTPFQWLPTPGRTILHFAAAHGEVKLLTNVIQRAGRELLDAKDQYGMTPLISAVLWGHVEVVGILLEAGADVEARCAPHGWTALELAAHLEDPEILRLLPGAGIDDPEDARDVLVIQRIIDMFSYEMDKCRWCTLGVQAKVFPDSRRFLRTALERSQIKRPESKWRWRISGCTEVGRIFHETKVLAESRKRAEF